MHRLARIRLLELGLVAVAMLLLGELGARSFGSLAHTGGWWLLIPVAGFGILAADFATGTVHWFCDRFFHEDTPVLGPLMIRPFREHHRDPEAMTRHGLLELHGNSCLPVIATLVLARLLPAAPAGPVRLGFELWLWFFLVASMATNQFHMWAHARSVPVAARWLQRRGVILSPARHAHHHQDQFDRSYCMTSGVLNPFLDRIDFFGRIERGIRRVAR